MSQLANNCSQFHPNTRRVDQVINRHTSAVKTTSLSNKLIKAL